MHYLPWASVKALGVQEVTSARRPPSEELGALLPLSAPGWSPVGRDGLPASPAFGWSHKAPGPSVGLRAPEEYLSPHGPPSCAEGARCWCHTGGFQPTSVDKC